MKQMMKQDKNQILKQKIIKRSALVCVLLVGALLAGCASQSLSAPCPDYGKQCSKKPINSWDTSTL